VFFKAREYTEVVELLYNAVKNLKINDDNFSALATIIFRAFLASCLKAFKLFC